LLTTCNSGSGGATSTEPTGGFADATLASVIRERAPTDSSPGSGTGKPSSPPSPGDPSAQGGGSNAGAIAGGVVGGLALLVIIAGAAAWFLLRRKRQRRLAPVTVDHKYSSPAAEMDGRYVAELHGNHQPQEAGGQEYYELPPEPFDREQASYRGDVHSREP
jgi:hypothetical protein